MLFFFEVDEDGWVLRQVELCGPNRLPTVAAALSEWPDANREGLDAVRAYDAKYGGLADLPITEWDAGFSGIEIDHVEFEKSGIALGHMVLGTAPVRWQWTIAFNACG